MPTMTLSMEEAIARAIEDELRAQAFYSQAAARLLEPRSRDLLGRLAAFEQYHYRKLVELSRSLQEQGLFIDYRPPALDDFLPLVGGAEAQERLQALVGPVDILRYAIGTEQSAARLYAYLAQQTTDVTGQTMFRHLASEERLHQRLLEAEQAELTGLAP